MILEESLKSIQQHIQSSWSLGVDSSCANRLVPSSDSLPKLQLVFLRKRKCGLYKQLLQYVSHEIIQQLRSGFVRSPGVETVTFVWRRGSERSAYWPSEPIIKLPIHSRRDEHQASRNRRK